MISPRFSLTTALQVVCLIGVSASLAAPELRAEGIDEKARRHALSLIGDPKYPKDFKQFSWVNGEAPKGGSVSYRAVGTFDTLNRYSFKGLPAIGLAQLDATLMERNPDEPSTDYGLIAEWVTYPPDFSSATFGLRAEARFHDGKPITPEDVIFSLDAIKKANPRYGRYYENVVRAEKVAPRQVRFIFDKPGNRELPQIIGGLSIVPKHYWTGRNGRGEERDLSLTTMEAPVGSGPYRIGAFEGGRKIVYERVKDWWAKDLAVNRGQWNFDRLTFVYYRDRLPAFEGFKAGETDFWAENSAKGWATGFDFEAVKSGQVRREELPKGDIVSMQGFIFNLRRAKFADRRVREAFNLAFNFEWANKSMFFDQYKRSTSYFGNSELQCRDLPVGRELEILETVRDMVPPEVFKTPFKNPTNHEPRDFRNNLGQAAKLLAAAGYTLRDGVMTGPKGETLALEVLLAQPAFERLVLAYKAELAKLGINVSVRVVDSALYRRRIQAFEFDMIVAGFPQSLSPGNEQRDFWGSAAAGQEGSYNLIGIKDPAIDKLIERLIYAKDRDDLVAATRALDRLLLWGHYLVPHFHAPFDRVAYWKKFGRPAEPPKHGGPEDTFLRSWWYDDKAAASLAAGRKG